MLAVAIVDQRVQIVRGLEDDVAALAAVAAVRPAEFDELLAAKAHRAAAAIAAFQVDLALVEEFHRICVPATGFEQKRGAADRSPSDIRRCREAAIRRLPPASGGTTEMNLRPPMPVVKLHGAGFQREQRVVAAHADPLAGMKLGAALPHDDVAGNDDLAAEFLDAEPPSGAVAAVARRAARFLVCHLEPPGPPPA